MAQATECLHQVASWAATTHATTGTYIVELQRLLAENASCDPWLHMDNACTC
jgi:hypothetical protein